MSNDQKLENARDYIKASDLEGTFAEDDGGYVRQQQPQLCRDAAIAIALGLLVASPMGTGYAADTSLPSEHRQITSTAPCFISTLPEVSDNSISQENVSRMIAETRLWLSLNISQLAEAMGVARPSVYAWIRGEAEIRSANYKRLTQLHSIARHWKELANLRLGKLMHTPTSKGTSLWELLTTSEISIKHCQSVLEEIRTVLAATTKAKPLSVAELMSAKGVTAHDESEQEASLLHNTNLTR